MIVMHCVMCEHSWRGEADAYLCPACGSDETEPLSEARKHNQFVRVSDLTDAEWLSIGEARIS